MHTLTYLVDFEPAGDQRPHELRHRDGDKAGRGGVTRVGSRNYRHHLSEIISAFEQLHTSTKDSRPAIKAHR